MTNEEFKQGQSLDEILASGAISTLFQPIVSLKNNTIYGYEALSRGPSDSPLHSPINLLDAASRHGRTAELDLLCRELAIQQFGRLNLPHKLFLDTIPAVLLQADYQHGLTLKFLEKANIPPNRVVIELTEQYPIEDYPLMREATEHYRSMGFTIALDDLGAGYAGLRTWSELKPDFVKLDRHDNTRFFPLLSLSIGMVKLRDFPILKTEAELSSHATAAKSRAKKIVGNSLYRLTQADCRVTQDHEL